MIKKEFPILEFDEDRNALIRPSQRPNRIQSAGEADRCVLCFFSIAIEKIISECPHKIVSYFKAESVKLPVYEIEYKGQKMILHQAYVGAPGAAGQIEELVDLGCHKFIACGGCGVLQNDLAVGHLIIPISAVRDEGTSYHYIEPAREISANIRVVEIMEKTMTEQNVPYLKAKTWTTDAFYRETPAKINLRKSEGCVTVEMEASAYFAASQYNNVDFGQILYAGDSLAGDEWDNRGWADKADVREYVLRLALDCCLNM